MDALGMFGLRYDAVHDGYANIMDKLDDGQVRDKLPQGHGRQQAQREEDEPDRGRLLPARRRARGGPEVLHVHLRGLVEPALDAGAPLLARSLDPALRDRFARAGLSHLLAISGLHVGMLAGMLFFVCRGLHLSPWGTALRRAPSAGNTAVIPDCVDRAPRSPGRAPPWPGG